MSTYPIDPVHDAGALDYMSEPPLVPRVTLADQEESAAFRALEVSAGHAGLSDEDLRTIELAAAQTGRGGIVDTMA